MNEKNNWIEQVVTNIDDEEKQEQVKRELEVKIHDLSFNMNEEKVIKKLGDPDVYYQKHYSHNNDLKFFKTLFVLGIILIVVGALFLYVILGNVELFDHGIRTAFGASTSPIYFGGMIIGLGIVFLVGSLRNFRRRK